MMRPITITLPEAGYKGVWGSSVLDNPEYQRAQAELNSTYRGMLYGIPVSKTRD